MPRPLLLLSHNVRPHIHINTLNGTLNADTLDHDHNLTDEVDHRLALVVSHGLVEANARRA